MRNLLALLAMGILAFAGIGWYLDWYHIKSTPESQGHRTVNIDFNKDKIMKDVHTGVEKGEKKFQEVMDKNKTQATSGNQPNLIIQSEFDFPKPPDRN